MIATYHNHSNHSDGKTTITEMVSFARELGIDELGISDHFCLVMVVKRIGLNLAICYNGLTHNSLQSKGDSSHGPL